MEFEKDKAMENASTEVHIPDYEKEIADIIKGNFSPKAMQEKLGDYHGKDIAEVMTQVTPAERKRLLRVLDVSVLAEIFEYVPEDSAALFLDEMDMKKAVTMLSELDSDSCAAILREMSKEKRNQLIDLLDDETKRKVELIASFDEDEIGSKLSDNFIELKNTMSVKSAMSALIAQAEDNDNISTLFVSDESGEFFGAMDLKDLITARQGQPLEDLISTSFPYVYGTENIDDCIERLKDYSEDSIPVLDNNSHILGVITAHSLIEVVDDEMGEDYAKLAGLAAEEDLNETTKDNVKKRLPWLVILLFLGMVVSSVVGAFEGVVAILPIVICFQSLILDMAGNVGTQSLAVTIRVLMDENLDAKDKWHLIAKEMKIGFCNGSLLGVLAVICLGAYIAMFKGYTFGTAMLISGCVGISLLVAIVISSLVGTLVPLFFHKVQVDPAVASGPLITTVNDLVAVVTYYGLAWLLLIEILHIV